MMNLGEAGGDGGRGHGEGIRQEGCCVARWGLYKHWGGFLGTSVTIFVTSGSRLVASSPQIFSCSQLPIAEVREDRELGKYRDCMRLSQ